ncbi:MAG TPA: DUF3048 domain-containing protein [Candidatus Limnocylindria bacterium]|nr:DUF3048 domain-containing protein [Candidatus Limnocylindria bacterium]
MGRIRVVVMGVVVALVAAACGGEVVRFQASPTPEPTAAPTQSPSPTATAVPTGTADPAALCTSCWPLNGKPLGDGAVVTKRPLVVKIDNVPAARPHYGITQADMVVEELVEGYVTRLVAIYQSQDPQTIGGVRSARLADRSLTTMVRGALVYSGTSDYAWSLISKDAANGRYVELSADHSDGYYRVGFRPAPYNMFTSASAQRDALARLRATTVDQIPRWPFLAAAEHPPTVGGMGGGIGATDITIPYRQDVSTVNYKYDAATRSYSRWQNESGNAVRDVDAANKAPVAAANVVIVYTEIWEVPEIVDAAGAHAHDMRLTGAGPATVFRDGLRQDGTWSRKDDNAAFTFTTLGGEQIKLSAGQTWVHIIPFDWSVTSK